MDMFVQYFQVYLLIMARFFAILLLAPLFSSNIVPVNLKFALSFIGTAIIFPVVANTSVNPSETIVGYVLTILNEVMIGILIGFLFSIIFATTQVATTFFEMQIGFGITETIDPLAQVNTPIIGQFQNLIGVLILIAIDGHYMIIRTLIHSFQALPVLSNAANNVFAGSLPALLDRFMYYMSALFSIALALAFPIIVTLFLMSISLGLLAKAAPQMNILLLGFPFQVALGITTYLLLIPVFVRSFVNILNVTFNDINVLISYLGGR